MKTISKLRLHPYPKYLSLLQFSAQKALAYRGTTLFNLLAGLIQLTTIFYLWKTVFTTNEQIESFDWHRMRTYILVAYAVNSLLTFSSEADMLDSIRTGKIAIELLRPINYLNAQLSNSIGWAVVEGLMGFIIALSLGLTILDIQAPPSVWIGLLFGVSVSLGFLVKFFISYLTGLLCFWTLNWVGLLWARSAITNIFSGALIPLVFFPEWLQTWVIFLPFPAIVHTPLNIYLGNLDGIILGQAIGIQVFWIFSLWILAQLLWIPSMRTLTIQGG